MTVAIVLVGLLTGSLQAQNRFGKVTITKALQFLPSKKYLIQGYRGDRDDKRNAEVQPWEEWDIYNYSWVFDRVPNMPPDMAPLFYIINVKTGLALTQDGPTDRNVSCWGRETNNTRQHWFFAQVRKPTRDEPVPPWTITNHGTGLALTQSWAGRKNDEVNVCTWDGLNPASADWQWRLVAGQQEELMRLRIESIRCIKPSTGKDAGTKILFSAIEMAIEAGVGAATGGTATAGAATAKQAAKEAVKQSLKISVKEGAKTAVRQGAQLVTREAVKNYVKKSATKKALKGAALAAGNELGEDNAESLVELAFDKLYGESPDQLEIRINGVSVWPNGGRDWRDTRSQQTHHTDIDYIFRRATGAKIQLIEYDHGSADDNLGHLTLDCSEVEELETYEGIIIKHEAEGSIYELTFSIQPLEWKPGQQARQATPAPQTQTAPPAPAPVDLSKYRVAQAFRTAGPLIDTRSRGPAKAMFWMNDRIMVVNYDGLVSSYVLQDGEAGGFQFYGDTVGTGAVVPKFIFPMDNRIMVVDQSGDTWYHTLANNLVGPAVRIPGHKIATDAAPVKGVFPLGNEIAVLNAAGQLWVHPVGTEIGQARNIPGGIGTGAHPPKAIFAMAGNVVVVNAQGDTWVTAITHEIGPPSRLQGFKIGADAQPPKAVIPATGTLILTVNAASEVWAHNLAQP